MAYLSVENLEKAFGGTRVLRERVITIALLARSFIR